MIIRIIGVLFLLYTSIYAGQYEFAGVGGRGRAMGGAYVALADDSTALQWNPAGMVLLERTELSMGIGANIKVPRIGGYYAGWNTPTELRKQIANWREMFPDSFYIPKNGGTQPSIDSMSVICPFDFIAVGFGMHNLKRIKFEFNSNGGKFENISLPAGIFDFEGVPWRTYESVAETSLIGISFKLIGGFSVGVAYGMVSQWGPYIVNKFPEDRWDANHPNTLQWVDTSGNYHVPNPINEPVHLTDRDMNTSMISLGALWRPFNFLNIGGVYKTFNKERIKIQDWIKEQTKQKANNWASGSEYTADRYYPIQDDFDWKLPTCASVGLAVRPTDLLTLSAQVDWIKYTDLDWDSSDEWIYNDALDIHFGAEYLIMSQDLIIPIRVGYYRSDYDMDYYNGTDEYMRNKYGKPAPEHHITLGTGFSREQWSFDLNFDFSSSKTNSFSFTISPVFYF